MSDTGEWDGTVPDGGAPAAVSPEATAQALARRVGELEGLLWEWAFSDWSGHAPGFASLDARSREALAARAVAPPRYMMRLGREFCRCLAPAWVEGPEDRREAPDFDGEWTARAGCAACAGSGRVECQGCLPARQGQTAPAADFLCLRCSWRPGRSAGGRVG